MQQAGFTLMHNNNLRPGYVSHFEAMLFCAQRGAVAYGLLPDGAVNYKKFFTPPGLTMCQVLLKRGRPVFCVGETDRAFEKFDKKRCSQRSSTYYLKNQQER